MEKPIRLRTFHILFPFVIFTIESQLTIDFIIIVIKKMSTFLIKKKLRQSRLYPPRLSGRIFARRVILRN